MIAPLAWHSFGLVPNKRGNGRASDVSFSQNDVLDLSQVTPENDFDLPTSVSNRGVDEPIHVFSYAGDDHITGSAFADCIKTGEGDYVNEPDNDWVDAGAGDDFIEGKAVGDTLNGGLWRSC